jgi:hypothetical protein
MAAARRQIPLWRKFIGRISGIKHPAVVHRTNER